MVPQAISRAILSSRIIKKKRKKREKSYHKKYPERKELMSKQEKN